MAPRISLITARSVAFRTKAIVPQKRICPGPTLRPQQRAASDNAASKDDPAAASAESNMHVSEEAAAMSKITGETPPDISQGTPVQEILERDQEAQEKAPEVLKQEIQQNNTTATKNPSNSRSFSTSARRHSLELRTSPSAGDGLPPPSSSAELAQFQESRIIGLEYPDAGFGHKFPIPDLKSLGRAVNFKKRYDPVVEQVTRSLMRDGKLSIAQKNMDTILTTLRTSPAPSNPSLISTLPLPSLPLNPVAYLTAIIDSVSPLIKIRQQRGVLGGGASMPLPVPLKLRQRRRTAIQWILASAESRREDRFADRVAKEFLSVAEGRSSSWEKRARVHKAGVAARANIRAAGGRRVRTKAIRGK